VGFLLFSLPLLSSYVSLLLISHLNSSNLTFSLAPGWAFVETEDWRKDVSGEWAESSGGCDEGNSFGPRYLLELATHG